MLEDARLDMPEMLNEDAWIVYRFGDGKVVSYSPDVDVYALRDGDTSRQFTTVADLAAFLAG